MTCQAFVMIVVWREDHRHLAQFGKALTCGGFKSCDGAIQAQAPVFETEREAVQLS